MPKVWKAKRNFYHLVLIMRYEEFLGKHEDAGDYFVPLGGRIAAILSNGKIMS